MPVPVQQGAFLASCHGLKLGWTYVGGGRTQEVPAPSQLTHLRTAVTSVST